LDIVHSCNGVQRKRSERRVQWLIEISDGRPITVSLARNSEKIDDVMLKVDGVMGKADNLMPGLNALAGGKDGGELFLAVKSIRELAEDFDKRSGALMTDGRRTLGGISRAVNNLDRNPTRLLFGAGNSSAPASASVPVPPAERRKP
jgi:phospholipid/cholesterol/gamma-HCH transport system substrate-binding protein